MKEVHITELAVHSDDLATVLQIVKELARDGKAAVKSYYNSDLGDTCVAWYLPHDGEDEKELILEIVSRSGYLLKFNGDNFQEVIKDREDIKVHRIPKSV